MSFEPQPWYGSPYPDAPAADTQSPSPAAARPGTEASGPFSESGSLSVGMRGGVRIAGVWLAYVAGGALLPGAYGVGVVGGVSLGVVLALVPLGVGLHGVLVYGRRVDRRIAAANEADDRRWA